MNQTNNSINSAGKYFLKKLEEAEASFATRTGPYIQWIPETEDDSVLRVQDYDLHNGIPTITASLNDFGQGGIACLAGPPNHGKSSLMTNMILHGLNQNPDLMIIDISLDDPLTKRYQQYLACLTSLAYQDISCPQNLSPNKQTALKIAKEQIRQYYREDRLRTYETMEKIGEGTNVRSYSMRDFTNVFNVMTEVRALYPTRKIVVFLDAWNNLQFNVQKGRDELGSVNEYLQQLKSHSESTGIGVFLSAHLKKIDGRKATLEDIKGTSDMIYTATWAGLLRNDFKENQDGDPLMYISEGKKWPLIIIEQPKNKSSTWELPLYYGLKAGLNQLCPVTRSEYRNIRSQIYNRSQEEKASRRKK